MESKDWPSTSFRELGHDVGVVVALEEAQLPAGGLGDAGDDGQAAVDVGAPVLADGEDLAGGQRLEGGLVLGLHGVLVDVALEALAVVGALAARAGAFEVGGRADVLEVVGPGAALGVALGGDDGVLGGGHGVVLFRLALAARGSSGAG